MNMTLKKDRVAEAVHRYLTTGETFEGTYKATGVSVGSICRGLGNPEVQQLVSGMLGDTDFETAYAAKASGAKDITDAGIRRSAMKAVLFEDINPSDAAKQYGLARRTIYTWIRSPERRRDLAKWMGVTEGVVNDAAKRVSRLHRATEDDKIEAIVRVYRGEYFGHVANGSFLRSAFVRWVNDTRYGGAAAERLDIPHEDLMATLVKPELWPKNPTTKRMYAVLRAKRCGLENTAAWLRISKVTMEAWMNDPRYNPALRVNFSDEYMEYDLEGDEDGEI